LKPFDRARFERTLERAKKRIASAGSGQREPLPFMIRTTGQVFFVAPSEIDWIEAADYYVSLHVGSRTHLLRRSLAELEEELDRDTFCRIHRSAIVKLEKVRSLELSESGEYDVLLHNGTRLRLSRRYRKALQSRLGISGARGPNRKPPAEKAPESSHG
jgi:two-component system, LytTR family, response regulator